MENGIVVELGQTEQERNGGGSRQRECHVPKIQRYGDDWEHGRLKQVEQLSVAEVGKVKSYTLGDWRDQQVKKAEKL